MRRESQEFTEYVHELCPNPRHVVEVGVFMPKDSKIIHFIEDPTCKTSLFEPQNACYRALIGEYGTQPLTEIHQVAIMAEAGQVALQVPIRRRGNPDAGASAYVEGIDSPFLRRGKAMLTEPVAVEHVGGLPFSQFDTGDVDALCVDTEGAEWFVLQTMISRPVVISLEMGGPNGYTNSYYDEITDWMGQNGYTEAHRTQEARITVNARIRDVFFADIIYTRNP